MSTLTANTTYLTSAPVAAGSTILAFGGSSNLELSYIGTVTFVGDGSNTAPVMNFIDGTNALGWTPSAVMVSRTGGNAANSIVGYVSTISNSTATFTLSAAPGSNASISYAVLILK